MTERTKSRSRNTRRNEKYNFSHAAPWEVVEVTAGGVAENQSNSSDFVRYLMTQSNFGGMQRDELLENLYIIDPEVSSAADSFSVMCKEAFQGFTKTDYAEYDDIDPSIDLETIGTTNEPDKYKTNRNLVNEMVDVANKMSNNNHLDDLFEMYSGITFIHGNLYLRLNSDISYTVLPNDRITIVDKKERLTIMNATGVEYKDVMTEPNYLVLDEKRQTQKVFNSNEFRIIKFREIPLNVEDAQHRMTYGIYSVSPLRRAIIPIWYKRLIMANDALWRAKNVPREHHKISAEAFNTGLYQGSNTQRLAKAQAAASGFIAQYKEQISQQTPDQAYITLDTIEIGHIEPNSAGYMQANELLEQMNDSIYSAVNLPRAVVKGVSGSNYASELIISGYTSTKVIQIANKIGAVILELMKLKLKQMNPAYPIEYLDIVIKYDLGTSTLERFKQAQIMASLGIFTTDEIRAVVDYKPLTKEQEKEELVNTSQKQVADGQQQSGKTKYPTTPKSASTQPTDSPTAQINKVTQKLSPSVKSKNK